jgi:BirA family transcriptional regulator, biotin operon repressor / biotin---[acetyl-CoA-carboxylase] ligase
VTHPWRLQVFEALPSTSDFCRERAEAGEPGGLAVLARRQTSGRGSRGRTWHTPQGNLAISVLLRPHEPARAAAQWSLLAAVALAEALSPSIPDATALLLKWPNDVLLDGRKVAGILLDSAADTEGALAWIVIGIGANLATAPELAASRAACIADVAPPPAAEPVANALLERLDHWRGIRLAHGFAPVRAAWLRRAGRIGAPTTLRLGGREISGQFAGLADDGSLLLQKNGRIEAFSAGEIMIEAHHESQAGECHAAGD